LRANPSVGRLIEWTGERCVPWSDAVQGVYEHLHRYHFAAGFVAGKRVLDLGSGEGYGAAILAGHAESVVGVEVDPATVAHSRATYRTENLQFVEASMLDLQTFEDGSFDVVVCFEAIEHVEGQEKVVSDVRRLLASDGLFIVSTPDRDAYNATLAEPNPFHVRELDRAELASLCAPFTHVALWSQSSVAGSRLALIDGDVTAETVAETVVSKSHETWVEAAPPVGSFYVLVASDAPIRAPTRSFLFDFDAAEPGDN
jgi:SAM-dependent methyltransferase